MVHVLTEQQSTRSVYYHGTQCDGSTALPKCLDRIDQVGAGQPGNVQNTFDVPPTWHTRSNGLSTISLPFFGFAQLVDSIICMLVPQKKVPTDLWVGCLQLDRTSRPATPTHPPTTSNCLPLIQPKANQTCAGRSIGGFLLYTLSSWSEMIKPIRYSVHFRCTSQHLDNALCPIVVWNGDQDRVFCCRTLTDRAVIGPRCAFKSCRSWKPLKAECK